jgi:hypothetical protein
MTELTQSRLLAGIWSFTLIHAGEVAPLLSASHDGRTLPDPDCSPGPETGTWHVTLPVPADILNDGLQTIVIHTSDGTALGSLAILAGEALANDIRAEISLLRSELDLLKSAFRRQQRDKQE